MNLNPEVYGAPETWQNAYNASGINSAIATALKCGKIKIPNFDAPNTGTYTTSQIRTAVSNNKITANTPIDNSICAVGQGDKSPFKKIACHYYDENNNTWYGPYITDISTPINMFPYETYSANGLQGIGGGATNINFATTSTGQVQIWSEGGLEYKNIGSIRYYNANWRLAPFTYYQLKSIVLQVLVNYTTNTTEPMTDAGLNEDHWITLDAWKNTYNQYPIVGCMVRMISANQITGDNIGYYNFVGDNNAPYRSAFGLALNSPLKHNDTDTLMSYTTFKMSQLTSEVVIFNKIYNSGGWGKYSKLFLPMWDKFSQYLQKPSRKCVLYRIPYSDTVYEDLMQAVASLGFCFTPTSKNSFNVNFTDADMCIPVIDENGVTTGEYTRGSDNVNNDLYNADSVRDKGYNPIIPPTPTDPNTYSLTTSFNTVGAVASTTKAYVINSNGIQGLSNELWTIIDNLLVNPSDVENLYNLSLDTFLTNNPIDAIVSVKKFPLLSVPHGENLENVYLGKVQTSAAAYPLAMQQARYNFTSIPIFPKFGNCFLDYAPYTKMQLYVPFCGTIDIDAADFMGRNLSVEMVIDFITGTVTAYVLANQLVVTSLTGTCAIDIPITGTEQATVNSAYESAAISERQTRASNIVSEFAGRFAHPIKSILHPISSQGAYTKEKLQQAASVYELTHMNMPLRQIGNASPLNSWALEFVCRLIIYYPDGECISFNATNEPSLITEKVQAFGAVNGFATVETDTLSSFTGFTQVSDVDLSGVSATDTEKEMILNLLQSGVYL